MTSHFDNRHSFQNNPHSIASWNVDEESTVPYPNVSLAWMTEVRKELLYTSDDLDFEKRAGDYMQRKNARFPEGYYANRLYETVVGKLLHDYLKQNNSDTSLVITSSHDDLFASCDYIISKADQSVRVDLTIASTKIYSFDQNYGTQSIGKKVQRFYDSPCIPQEYFATKPDSSPKPLPLIILRIDKSILSSFIHDFFEIIATQKTNMDLLDYFSEWINTDSNVTRERVAYLLWFVNDPRESRFVDSITNRISILLAWMEGVSTIIQ